MEQLLIDFLNSFNETLTAAIVIIAASMLLYNLTRNLRNRVARTSAGVLACVTIVYIGDVLIALGPGSRTYIAILRLQWVGIALIPATLFHLSDALLATTGLPSRGRRRRIARILYLISVAFLVAAAFTDILIYPVFGQVTSLRPGWFFWVYLLYFVLLNGIAFINVQRARQRCLTRSTQRRMGYLQIAMLMPPLGVFPFALLLGISDQFSLSAFILVNVGNVVIILMLLFLAYPLSFFGSQVPDRVVKADLLRFMLRGPGTALLVLATIIFVTPATRILSFPAGSFVPFAVVAVVLLWQWVVALILPWLEKRLIYFDEDDDQLEKLQSLSDRLLTRADLMQLIEATLEAICDFMRVRTSYLVSLTEDRPELVKVIGNAKITNETLAEEAGTLKDLLPLSREDGELTLHEWNDYWVMPLYSRRTGDHNLIGFIGIEARSPTVLLMSDEIRTLESFVRRAARTLDDMYLQDEVYAALEGLLPQYSTTRTRAAEFEYKPGRGNVPVANGALDREQIIEQVRAALRHYWGGAGLSNSRLLELNAVRKMMEEEDNNPVKALRAVLQKAIDRQKPDSQRKMTAPEWTIYNILQLRFVERVKVREVAMRIALSEPDLYRKQRVAIETVADAILDMEDDLDVDESPSTSPNL